MADYVPGPDASFNDWLENFNLVCAGNAVTLSLNAAELAEIASAATDFNTALSEHDVARNIAFGKTAAKRAQRTASESAARKYARQFLVDPNIPVELLGELGVKSGEGGIGPLMIPTELTAQGYANGENLLKWNRNGNSFSTTFIIEAKIGTSSVWTFVNTTTKSRFVHTGQIPGQQVIYRVYAKRADEVSGTSNEAAVYTGSDAETLFLSEAA